MTENKKEWSEPELIVLVRSKPEEAVLSGCKGSGSPGSSDIQNTGCQTECSEEGKCHEQSIS